MRHKNFSKQRIVFFSLLFFSLILVTSCTTRKKLVYLQDLEDSTIVKDSLQSDVNNTDLEYSFKVNDEIYININSLDPKTFSFFNGSTQSKSMTNGDASLYLNSYTISRTGSISLPIIGEIPIQGLTTSQAQDTITRYLGQFLKDVSVTVKLSGFKITLLGEVKNPGRYIDYVSQLNLLEALALAGDITIYGNRTKIRIIRGIDGKEEILTVNLLDKNILNSNHFQLLPNDVIYVEPLGTKTWGFDKFPYDILLSTISTIVTIYALTR